MGMVMSRQTRRVLGWTAAVAPTIAMLAFLISQGFCVAPWNVISRASARNAHKRIEQRMEIDRSNIDMKLDRLSDDLHLIMGKLGVMPR